MAVVREAGSLAWAEEFTYANGALATVSSGAWVTGFLADPNAMGVDTNQAAGSVSAGYAGAYTAKADFADGGEFIMNLPVIPASTLQLLWYCFIDQGTTAAWTNGFIMNINFDTATAVNRRIRMGHRVGVTTTTYGVDVTSVTLAAGMSFCMKIDPLNNKYSAHTKQPAGSWVQIGTDQTLPAVPRNSGTRRVAFETNSGVFRADYIRQYSLWKSQPRRQDFTSIARAARY